MTTGKYVIAYSWKFSSNMPDVYISRAGMKTKQLDEKFAQTELNAVNSELVEMEQARRIDRERIRQLESAWQQWIRT